MSTYNKRKALDNITNISEIVRREDKKQSIQDAKDMFPVIDMGADMQSLEEMNVPKKNICRMYILC